MDRRIVIVGFMGCGKTTVAKALAARLGCGLVDLDAVVSSIQNKDVPELIQERGEAGFRDAETAALQVVLDRHTPRIIALGGGTWTLERNRDLINQHGCVTIWLDAPFELCWQRITAQSTSRPLAPDETTARALYRERRPLYRLALLHITVSAEASGDELASQIVPSI